MTKRNAQSLSPMRFLNFRVEAEKVERLRLVAEADHRTVSQELRRLIDERLETKDAA